jgi:hypothetical protein
VDLVDQAHGPALVGAEEATRVDHRLGPRRADQPGQPLGAAGPGDDAQEDLGLAEPGVVGRKPEVGGQGQLAAAAERVAGHGGDHHLGDAGQGGEGGLEVGRPGRDLGEAATVHLLDVGPGGEHLLAAPEDDRTDPLVVAGLARRVPQLVLDLGVERIDGRPVEPDGPDPAGLVDLQTYELTHQRSLPAVRQRRSDCMCGNGACGARRRCRRPVQPSRTASRRSSAARTKWADARAR